MTHDIRNYLDIITKADKVLSQLKFIGIIELYLSFDEGEVADLDQIEQTFDTMTTGLAGHFSKIAQKYNLSDEHTGWFGTLIEQEYATEVMGYDQLINLCKVTIAARKAMASEINTYERGLINMGVSNKIIEEKTVLSQLKIIDDNNILIPPEDGKTLFFAYESGMEKLIKGTVTPEQMLDYVQKNQDGYM